MIVETGFYQKENISSPKKHTDGINVTKEYKFSNGTMNTLLQERLESIAKTVSDDRERSRFQREMAKFLNLYSRYKDLGSEYELDWDQVNVPEETGGIVDIVDYNDLIESKGERMMADHVMLSKIAVLKLNGGLGTTMGCVGPKSAIQVRDGMSFLDMAVKQIEWLNASNRVTVPLILMNSFNTDAETRKLIGKSHGLQIETFNQSCFPRFTKDTHVPIATSFGSEKKLENDVCLRDGWYPPGHGNFYEALEESGMLDSLIDRGIEYLFVSNVDNLGATVDLQIVRHIFNRRSEFVMEVTPKTCADVKGGTLIRYKNEIRLLEAAQVPPSGIQEFTSINRFKIFNTNNLWINLKAIKRILGEKQLNLDIIPNEKQVNGIPVIQLETAIGSAIRYFADAHGLKVPRSRFLPVKNCTDLFMIRSDLYKSTANGFLTSSCIPLGLPNQQPPTIKLGDTFRTVKDFLARVPHVIQIASLRHLTVVGDVYFGSNVTLIGTVVIVAPDGSRMDIPNGCTLQDKVITGAMRVLNLL